MCTLEFYKGACCRHKWARVAQPCGPGMGFSTCPWLFGTGRARPQPEAFVARQEPCPQCDLGGVYSRNEVRAVVRFRRGFRLGLGPGRRDPGVEVRCGVM